MWEGSQNRPKFCPRDLFTASRDFSSAMPTTQKAGVSTLVAFDRGFPYTTLDTKKFKKLFDTFQYFLGNYFSILKK